MSTRDSGPVPKKVASQKTAAARKKARDAAATELFARHASSRQRRAVDAVPERDASVETAPIGLRKASVSESESAPNHRRGSDVGELARSPAGTRETQVARKPASTEPARVPTARKSSEAIKSGAVATPSHAPELAPRVPASRARSGLAGPRSTPEGSALTCASRRTSPAAAASRRCRCT
jgi:hypothetical protein